MWGWRVFDGMFNGFGCDMKLANVSCAIVCVIMSLSSYVGSGIYIYEKSENDD